MLTNDRPKKFGFCPKPFEYLAVHNRGIGRVCCGDWLETPIGDLRRGSFDDLWNSQTAQDIRKSILDGSYKYCNQETCPALIQGTLKRADQIHDEFLRDVIDNQRVVLEKGPRTLSLTYDSTCNLKCPSCRSDFISLKGKQYQEAEELQARIFKEGLADVEELVLTGYGDPFASRLFRKLLQSLDARDFPRLSIKLMTNGLLFTPAMWSSLEKIQSAVSSVEVSIDAATAETYAINRGGSFKKLLENLSFISGLLRQGKVDWFEISFVVQTNNFREMKQFVEMGRKYRCNRILFQRLIRWDDTYTNRQFRTIAIHDPKHPDHQEFLDLLNDPIFHFPPVDLSNLENLTASRFRSANLFR